MNGYKVFLMTQKTTENLNHISFEDAIDELEDIVVKLEEGEVDLDSLVSEYRRGAKLLSHCRSKVSSAEIHIKEVDEAGDLSKENSSDAE